MDPLIKTIYFARELIDDLNELAVVDIEKYPEVKEKFDPKAEGKYFLISKDHPSLECREHKGTLQEFFDNCFK